MIAGAETMSWRGKYTGWYKVAKEIMPKLLPDLGDTEIMENVTPEDQFISPTGQEHLPKNKAKPLPRLSIKLSDNNVELGILYNDPEQLELLKNIFRETHKLENDKLLKQLQTLDPNYETILYSRGRDEKPFLLRKYVSARLDEQLFERLIEESDGLRKGGRQIQSNQSIYIPPKTPELYLTRIIMPLNEKEYRAALENIKPIFATVSGIKTQREIISERLSKPKVKRNMYREFIEALNEVKKRDLISGERWREINQQWRDNEDEREALLDMLNELLNTQS
ncbi:hypothetical protein E2P71_06605 [Candidatus Bathyarchaeota archaeon]|nr:hypothetical protein E2P71_06605 [Candidatus Bathyarchaeota archaeon]